MFSDTKLSMFTVRWQPSRIAGQTGTFFAIQEYISHENISVTGSYAPQKQVPICPGFAIRAEFSRIPFPLRHLFALNGTLLTLRMLTSGALWQDKARKKRQYKNHDIYRTFVFPSFLLLLLLSFFLLRLLQYLPSSPYSLQYFPALWYVSGTRSSLTRERSKN